MPFPSIFPANCPPDDALDADILVYRTVSNDPPQEDDFRNDVEMGKTKANRKPKCHNPGISMLRSREDAMHHRSVFGWAAQHIAVGRLMPQHGKVKDSPVKDLPSHVDWWCYDGIERSKVFKVVEGT